MESLVKRHSTRKRVAARTVGQIRNIFSEGEGQLERRRAKGVLNNCAREPKARTRRFLSGKLISDHGLLFLPTRRPTKSGECGQESWGIFQECPWLWTTGCGLARRLHQLKVTTAAMDLGLTVTLISA